MANAAGGHFQAQGGQGGHTPAQFPGPGGQYYPMGQQQMPYQYYGHVQHPQQMGYQQQWNFQAQRPVVQKPQPPPPPPPPGEVCKPVEPPLHVPGMGRREGNIPPLQPPPLPPMFPWMSPALVESMTSAQFGKPFEEQASTLPFVPIVVNEGDLQKMTENVIKEAEEIKSHQLQYYKDVLSQDLPQKLKDMFQPLYCKLCILTLSSPVVAKDHYNGKRHKKAIEGWFIKNPQLASKPKEQGRQEPNKSDTGLTGLGVNATTGAYAHLNGYVMDRQNPPNMNAAPPPATPSALPQQKIPGNGSSQLQRHNPNARMQQSIHTPTTVTPAIDNNGNQNRKRSAAPTPPPSLMSLQVNTQKANNTVSKGQPSVPGKPVPPPFQPMANNDAPKGLNNKSQQQQQQNYQQIPGPSGWKDWKETAQIPSASSNFNSADFQQQQAKRPKWEDNAKPQPSPQAPPPQQQQNFTSGNGGGGTGVPGASNKGLCQICNVELSSTVMADQHMKGKNHAAKLAALKDQGLDPRDYPPIMPGPPRPKPPPDTDPSPAGSEVPFIGPNPPVNKPFVNNDRAPSYPPRGGGNGGNFGRNNSNNQKNFGNRNNNFGNQRHKNNFPNRGRFNKGNFK